MTLRAVGLSAALLSFACGGGASLSLNGTIRGQTVKPAEAVSSPATVTVGILNVNALVAVISDATGLCGKIGSNTRPKSSHFLILGLAEVNQTSLATSVASSVGTYTVYAGGSGLPPAKSAFAQFGATDESCNDVAAQASSTTSGTVNVTSIGNGAVAGTFDLTFDGGDHVTGSFSTARCDGISAYLNATTHSCG